MGKLAGPVTGTAVWRATRKVPRVCGRREAPGVFSSRGQTAT